MAWYVRASRATGIYGDGWDLSQTMVQKSGSYTGFLAPGNFNGAVFTCVYFQKIAQLSGLCNFQYISEGIPSLMSSWLLMVKVSKFRNNFWYLRILPKSEQTNSVFLPNSTKNEFVRSFFGRIRGYQESFQNYLTFNYSRKRHFLTVLCIIDNTY